MTVFTTALAGVQEYRLDVITTPDDDTIDSMDFTTTVARAEAHARQLLANHNGPDDRFGELWMRDPNGSASAEHVDTIHLG